MDRCTTKHITSKPCYLLEVWQTWHHGIPRGSRCPAHRERGSWQSLAASSRQCLGAAGPSDNTHSWRSARPGWQFGLGWRVWGLTSTACGFATGYHSLISTCEEILAYFAKYTNHFSYAYHHPLPSNSQHQSTNCIIVFALLLLTPKPLPPVNIIKVV